MATLKYSLAVLLFPFLSQFWKDVLPNLKEEYRDISDSSFKSKIAYEFTFKKGNLVVKLEDTLYVKGDYIIEPNLSYEFETFPVYHVSPDSNDVLQSELAKEKASRKKVTNYLVTNWRLKAGMLLDLHSPPNFIDSYSIKNKYNKLYGYPLLDEFAIIGKTEKDRQAYVSTGRDTIVRNRKYKLVTCEEKVKDSMLFDNSPGVLQKALIFLDPQKKEHCYPFISKMISERLGGAVMEAHYYYDKDREVHFVYHYQNGLNANDHVLVNKYINSFLQFQPALDSLLQ